MSTELIDGAWALVKEKSGGDPAVLLNAIKRHPLLALLGVGLGWLLIDRLPGSDGEEAPSEIEEWGEGFRDTRAAMRDDAVYFANETGDRLEDVSRRMLQSAEELEETVEEVSSSVTVADLRPVAIGTGLFALGVAAGFLVAGDRSGS